MYIDELYKQGSPACITIRMSKDRKLNGPYLPVESTQSPHKLEHCVFNIDPSCVDREQCRLMQATRGIMGSNQVLGFPELDEQRSEVLVGVMPAVLVFSVAATGNELAVAGEGGLNFIGVLNLSLAIGIGGREQGCLQPRVPHVCDCWSGQGVCARRQETGCGRLLRRGGACGCAVNACPSRCDRGTLALRLQVTTLHSLHCCSTKCCTRDAHACTVVRQ